MDLSHYDQQSARIHSEQEHFVIRIREDHAYMIELMQRIMALCEKVGQVGNCNGCEASHRSLCNDNIDWLIRTFVDFTLRHHLVESTLMAEGVVPQEHRKAHVRAHIELAEQMKAIRVIHAKDGNGIVAIEGVTELFATLAAHMADFDGPLEEFLLAA